MVVGILLAGRMGGTLARLLADAGHEVRLANSGGPASGDGVHDVRLAADFARDWAA
jgi:predicted dinucleotide-binding enzyme